MIALKCNHWGLADQLILLVGALYFELILKLTISIIVFFSQQYCDLRASYLGNATTESRQTNLFQIRRRHTLSVHQNWPFPWSLFFRNNEASSKLYISELQPLRAGRSRPFTWGDCSTTHRIQSGRIRDRYEKSRDLLVYIRLRHEIVSIFL